MKLVVKTIAETDSGSYFANTPLFPCSNGCELYLKGYIEFGDYFPQEYTKQILVAIWDKNHDYEYVYDAVLEYLLVDVKYLNKQGSDPDMPYLHSAKVIQNIPKDAVEVKPEGDDIEPCIIDRVFLLSKKLI